VNIVINDEEYRFIPNAIRHASSRESFFALARKVFGLDFTLWFQSGFYDGSYMPYTLFDADKAVSSVGIVVNNFKWLNEPKKYVQISTVATDPDYRKRGLNRWLMETALAEWKDKCDGIYLYANDSVVDFYPRFGFVQAFEYRYRMPVAKRDGAYRKLSLSDKNDVELLIKKLMNRTPFPRWLWTGARVC
jgi:GNAT superfamily N-acetyltransferase